nr:MAG TPA: Protein of unknown function (DUF1642) [Caudoviricetes sp.]
MNKQELIEKIEAMPNNTGFIRPKIDKHLVLALVRQLDEPQKVVVPKFVADWYEENKDDFEFNVWDWIAFRNEPEKLENKEFNYWINNGEGNPIQTLVNMHQFGYEVEKEKRYCISMPKARNYKNHAQILCEEDGKMFWCGEWYRFKTKFTRKELEEAGFGWVFDCPGIEIEEVE